MLGLTSLEIEANPFVNFLNTVECAQTGGEDDRIVQSNVGRHASSLSNKLI